MSDNIIKIYGERHTGSNYFENLLMCNLEVKILNGTVPYKVSKLYPGSELLKDFYFLLTYKYNLGWKHSMAPTIDLLERLGKRDVIFLVLTKNPYSWLLSLYRKPYHQKGSKLTTLKEFLVTPWKTVGRGRYKKKQFENPIQIWNKKNESYLKLNGTSRCLNIKYEDLLSEPEQIISHISQTFNIRKKHEIVEHLTKSYTGFSGSVNEEKEKNNSYYRDYYLNEKWQNELDEECINIINKELNMTLMEQFEYKKL